MRDEREALFRHGDPFAQMRAVQERVNELRDQVNAWISSPPDPEGSKFHTIPASPDDVFWLLDRVQRVLTTMQDATHTYGIVDTNRSPVESITPMMVERDALAEALHGD